MVNSARVTLTFTEPAAGVSLISAKLIVSSGGVSVLYAADAAGVLCVVIDAPMPMLATTSRANTSISTLPTSCGEMDAYSFFGGRPLLLFTQVSFLGLKSIF